MFFQSFAAYQQFGLVTNQLKLYVSKNALSSVYIGATPKTQLDVNPFAIVPFDLTLYRDAQKNYLPTYGAEMNGFANTA